MDAFGLQYSRDDAFTARMRFHQSWYRAKRLKVPYGYGPRRSSTSKYGNMLAEQPAKSGMNFLTSEIQAVYEKRKSTGRGGVEPFRCERNMLSSQPMCFNLFGPLVADLSRANRLMRALLPKEVGEMLCAEIEFRPAQNPLGDRTAFDAFFEYRDMNGQRAFLGIETKLTDKFSRKRYKYEDHPAYGELTRRTDSPWKREFWDRLPASTHNQLWRNHLLVEATKRLPGSPHGNSGKSILVVHPMDASASVAANEYREFLVDPTAFLIWPLDCLVAAWVPQALGREEIDWLERFQDRYLRLELSAPDWEDHKRSDPPQPHSAEC